MVVYEVGPRGLNWRQRRWASVYITLMKETNAAYNRN